MKSFLLVLCVALSVVGCNSSKNMAKLSGVKWVLQTLNDKELSLTDPNSEIFIQFNEAEHRVNGRGGCNRFFGNYEMESSRLKFSPMGATRMACPDLHGFLVSVLGCFDFAGKNEFGRTFQPNVCEMVVCQLFETYFQYTSFGL